MTQRRGSLGQGWWIAAGAVFVALVALIAGYLLHWPASVGGHRLRSGERGPLSEWVPGAVTVFAVLAAVRQLKLNQESASDDLEAKVRMSESESARTRLSQRLAALDYLDAAVVAVTDYLVATVDLIHRTDLALRARLDRRAEGDGVVDSERDRLQAALRLRTAVTAAMDRLRAIGADPQQCASLQRQFGDVFNQFGQPTSTPPIAEHTGRDPRVTADSSNKHRMRVKADDFSAELAKLKSDVAAGLLPSTVDP